MCLRKRQSLAGWAQWPEAVRHEQRTGDLGHGLAGVHGCLLNPAERLGLAQTQPGHEHTLGPIHQLARLELLLERFVLLPHRFELAEARDRYVEGGTQLLRAERLHEEAKYACIHGPGRHRGVSVACEEDDGTW